MLFAQLVDDPSSWPERFPTEEAQEAERKRLHEVIERLVPWEASNNESDPERGAVGDRALGRLGSRRGAAAASDDGKAILHYLQTKAPPVYDPFCGGGSIPLEAQRLGLRAYGSDLNPVAVLIAKALVEIPPKFAGRPPVNPDSARSATAGCANDGSGAQGLAEDVRYYGQWMRDEAERRIGHLYPKAKLPDGSGSDGDRLALGAHGALARSGGQRARWCRSFRPSCCRRTRGRRSGLSRMIDRVAAKSRVRGASGTIPTGSGCPHERGHKNVARRQVPMPAHRLRRFPRSGSSERARPDACGAVCSHSWSRANGAGTTWRQQIFMRRQRKSTAVGTA